LAILETFKIFIIPFVNHQKPTPRLSFYLFKYIAQSISLYFCWRQKSNSSPLKTSSYGKTNLSLFHLSALLFIFLLLHNKISAGHSLLGSSLAAHSASVQ
jgi:hypothetical protein